MKRISKISAVTVPLMAAFYIIACLAIIFVNFKNLPTAVTDIFKSAFSFSSVSGGVGGFFISESVRYGFSRGLFSNEAGMGSSPTVHASSSEISPNRQASWGVFEVFCDTVAVCGVTALALTTSNAERKSSPSELIYGVFTGVFGDTGGVFLSVSIVFFALASIFCWYIYGSEALKYLSPSRALNFSYRILFTCAVFLGAVWGHDAVWQLSDILNGVMAFINLAVLVLLSNQVTPPCENKKLLFENK